MKANIKKDADGLDNIDDFWDDGNDDHRRSSASNSTARNQTSFIGLHRDQRDHNASLLDDPSAAEEETDDIEDARRQHPSWLNEYLEYETPEENQIPNELLSTPSSRRSDRASFHSRPFDSNFSSRTDNRHSGDIMSASWSVMYDSSMDEHSSPPLESVKRKIDFSSMKTDKESVDDYSRVSKLLQTRSYAASSSKQRTRVIQSSSDDTDEQIRTTASTPTKKSMPNSVLVATSRSGTPVTRSLSTWRTRDSGAAANTSDAREGAATSSHSRNTPASKMFDFGGLDLGNGDSSGPDNDDDGDVHSGPDDNSSYSGPDADGRFSEQDGDNKGFAPVDDSDQGFPYTEDDGFFMHTPDTPSRPSHSVLVLDTPEVPKQRQRRYGSRDHIAVPERGSDMPWNKRLEQKDVGTVELASVIPTTSKQYQRRNNAQDHTTMSEKKPVIPWSKKSEHKDLGAAEMSPPTSAYQFKDEDPTPQGQKSRNDMEDDELLIDRRKTNGKVQTKNTTRSGTAGAVTSRQMRAQVIEACPEPVETEDPEITGDSQQRMRRRPRKVESDSRQAGTHNSMRSNQTETGQSERGRDRSKVRRSKRVTYKPLEFWRNERVILGKNDGTPLPVPEVKGIIRAVPQDQPKSRGARRRQGSVQLSTGTAHDNTSRRFRRKLRPGSDDEEDDNGSSADSGNLSRQGSNQDVSQKCETIDHLTGRTVRRVLAETKDSEQEQFQDAAGGEYQFYRGLEDDCISTGMVRIHGLGTKPNKNASVSSMMYYVIQGTVRVTIYNSTFVLRRGGRFLVPKCNQYMIQNLSRTDCLLLFSQSKAAIPSNPLTTDASGQIATSATRETGSYTCEKPVPSSSADGRTNAHRNPRKRKNMQDYEEAVTDDQESEEDTRSRAPAPRRTLRSARKMYA
ncbi:hypothetical protein BGZ51_002980 [Haplosporangium sp. Z 767]|nr:hypothetical protein BGZ51_002980 [Haplosporangium sp. Z 767]